MARCHGLNKIERPLDGGNGIELWILSWFHRRDATLILRPMEAPGLVRLLQLRQRWISIVILKPCSKGKVPRYESIIRMLNMQFAGGRRRKSLSGKRHGASV